jgi:hypothetical protein
VLKEQNRLLNFLDVFRQGEFLVTKKGFGLFDNKCFQWFTSSGNKIAELKTRDPIRKLYDSDSGVVFETRQHRAKIEGLWLFQ